MQNSNDIINISVIIPTSGRVDLFKETINCLTLQTYKHFEVVVSDDSPKEEDRKKIKKTVEDFADKTGLNVKYIFTKPALYQAGNTTQAINNASFDYIHLLHSDDLLAPTCLEKEIELLKQYPHIEFIYHDVKSFHGEFVPNDVKTFSFIDAFMYFKTFIDNIPPMPSSWFFKKDIYFKLEGFKTDYKYVCDWEFFYRVLKLFIVEKKSLIRINKGLVGWRQHTDSVSSTLWVTFHKEAYQHLSDIYERELKDKYVDGVFLSNFYYKCRNRNFIKFWSDFKYKLPRSLFKFPEMIKLMLLNEKLYNKVVKANKQKKYAKLFSHKTFKLLKKKYINKRTIKLPHTSLKSEISSILEINPFYTISGNNYNDICINFNNTFDLSSYKSYIETYENIRIININSNRFYMKVLNEIVKNLKKGQIVEFAFWNNEFLTDLELVNVIHKNYSDRLLLFGNPENLFKYNMITFECISDVPDDCQELHTGFSFGIVNNKDVIKTKQFIESIQQIVSEKPYEILLFKDKNSHEFEIYKNIKFLDGKLLTNSSQKKNYICEKAIYSDIIISNGEFILSPDFNNYHFNYGVAVPKLVNTENERVVDWSYEDNKILKPLNYREYSTFTALNQNIVLIRKNFYQKHRWNNNVDDLNNIDFSMNLRQNNVIIEILDLNLISKDEKLKHVTKELIYNSEYEIIENKYVCGHKAYSSSNNEVIAHELI